MTEPSDPSPATATTPQTIALIGAGRMGHGIATSLQRHGQRLRVLAHPGNQPLDDLLAAGAQIALTPQETVRGCDALLLCVTGSPQVEAVLTGPDGALRALPPGALVIDCSTSTPESTIRMAQAVQQAGGRFLDAAMTRTPREAAQGRLNLLVGASDADLAAARPILQCIAESITHAGPVGAGHRIKLLHNFVSLGTVALIAEAAACASRAGIDPSVLADVLARGGGSGVALDRLRPYLERGDSSGLQFTLANAEKDLRCYREMAAGLHAARAIADAVSSTLARGLHEAGEAAMVLELARLLASGDKAVGG